MNWLSYFSKRNDNFLFRSKEVFQTINKVLKNETVANNLKKNGYAVLPFLSKEEVEKLNRILKEFLTAFDKKPDTQFYSSITDSVIIKEQGRRLVLPIIEPLFDRIVNVENAQLGGGGWLFKPPKGGEFDMHQDPALVDESRFTSLNMWIPLQDVTVENGCMYVIPGSHLWKNHQRPFGIPWQFEDYRNVLRNYICSIEMKAGEILLYDSALIHGSGKNKSENIRSALIFFCTPKNIPMIYQIVEKDTPKNKIEQYNIDKDFYVNEDFRKRPDSTTYPFQGYIDKINLDLNEAKIRKLLKGN